MHERGRPILAAETPINLHLRLKGTRLVLKLPWSLCYLKAAQLEAAQIRLNKINARKAAKKTKKK